jgi:chromate reductase
MKKIVIISSTSRPDSNTNKVSKIYEGILKSKKVDVEILDLNVLTENFILSEIHGKRSEAFANIIAKYISNNSNFIFVVPEYNGSFPGVLKLFIDCIHPREWTKKYACLVGVSDGRAGNLRGMDHLSAILGYLKMHVFHHKLPISSIDKLLDNQNKFSLPEQMKVCELQVQGFLDWIS